MSSLEKILSAYLLHPKQVIKIKKGYILKEEEHTYCYLKKRKEEKALKEELLRLGYDGYSLPVWEEEDYALYLVEENSFEEKDFISLLGKLHSLTKEGEENQEWISLFSKRIEEYRLYYLSFQEKIGSIPFPRIDYYTLLLNISLFYRCLDLSEYYLNIWKEKERPLPKGILLGNLSSWNLQKTKNKKYFLDFGESRKDCFLEEVKEFLRKYPSYELLKTYEEENPLGEDKVLLYSLLLLPEKLDFRKTIYENTYKIHQEIERLLNTLSWLEENEKDEKADKEEFQKE